MLRRLHHSAEVSRIDGDVCVGISMRTRISTARKKPTYFYGFHDFVSLFISHLRKNARNKSQVLNEQSM